MYKQININMIIIRDDFFLTVLSYLPRCFLFRYFYFCRWLVNFFNFWGTARVGTYLIKKRIVAVGVQKRYFWIISQVVLLEYATRTSFVVVRRWPPPTGNAPVLVLLLYPIRNCQFWGEFSWSVCGRRPPRTC